MKDHCDNVYKGLEDSRGLVNVGFFSFFDKRTSSVTPVLCTLNLQHLSVFWGFSIEWFSIVWSVEVP